MKNPFLSNPALTLGLAFLMPIAFVFSLNAHAVTVTGMLISFGITFLFACLIVTIASVGIRLWRKKSSNVPVWLRWIVKAVFCLILIEIGCFLLQGQLIAAIPDHYWLRVLVFKVFPFIISLLLVRKYGFFPINVFLCAFLSLSLINLGISLSENDGLDSNNALQSYKIKERPNIYLFFLESYHSLDIQKEVYGIDTAGIEAYLAKNDFINYGKIYSNSPATILSFTDTFTFDHTWKYTRPNSDVMRSIRPVLGGNKQNTLFRLLKTNGYTTVLLVGDTSYYGARRGEYLDDSDSLVSDNRWVLLDMITCFEMLNSRFRGNSPFSIRKYYTHNFSNTSVYTGSLENRVSKVLAIHKKTTSPLFLAFEGGAEHTPPDGSYTWRQHEEWVQSGDYQRYVENGNQELQRICDALIASDPGAVIILIGDHGAWRFRDAEGARKISSLENMITSIEEKGLSWQDFCEDKFGVFLAIRLPHGHREDISYGQPMSHANLFRHVFAYLNHDKSILKTRAPSNSYFMRQEIIKEGKIVRPQAATP